jgi:hypothetical protein
MIPHRQKPAQMNWNFGLRSASTCHASRCFEQFEPCSFDGLHSAGCVVAKSTSARLEIAEATRSRHVDGAWSSQAAQAGYGYPRMVNTLSHTIRVH